MKMVITEPLGVEGGKLLAVAREALGDRVKIVYYNTKTADTTELMEHGRDTKVIVVSNLSLNAQVIEGCGSSKLPVVVLTGVDHIAMNVRRRNGVMVCNCAGYSTCVVADLVFGILISLYRNVIPYDKACREEGTKGDLAGLGLEGKTFSVVGTGAVGLRIAAIAQAFECRVLVYSRTVRDVPNVRYVDLGTPLAECDVVSLHTLLTGETRGLMNEERIGLVKKNVVPINMVRESAVDSNALAKALKEGRITGACTDVFGSESPARRNHLLFSAPNTTMTPHVAFATRKALVKRAIIAFDNVVDYLSGTPRNMTG